MTCPGWRPATTTAATGRPGPGSRPSCCSPCAARPGLPTAASAGTVNVAVGRDEPGSLRNLSRELTRLRRGHPALRGGDYQPRAPAQPVLYAYLRRTGDQRILVTLNFGDQPRDLDHPQAGTGRILLSTHTHPQPASRHPLRLAPYEGVIANLT